MSLLGRDCESWASFFIPLTISAVGNGHDQPLKVSFTLTHLESDLLLLLLMVVVVVVNVHCSSVSCPWMLSQEL